MPPLRCPHCQGDLKQTKRLSFPDGGVKLIFECTLCERARVVEEASPKVSSEIA